MAGEERRRGNPFRGIYIPSDPQELLDIAFRRAMRASPKISQRAPKSKKAKSASITRIRTLFQELSERLWKIVRSFPNLDELHPFYLNVLEMYASKDDVKIALAKIKGAALLIERLGKEYIIKIKLVQPPDETRPVADVLREIDQLRKAAYGRICSVVYSLKKEFTMLRELVRKLSKLPDFDPNLPILVVCGPTNAGKSTFVKTVSNARVEIADYPFTTKNVTFGVMKWPINPALEAYLQVVDTPGLLDRPMEERKEEEHLALRAIKTLPNAVLFLFDGSDAAIASAEEQIRIFETCREFFKERNPLLFVAINKIDIAHERTVRTIEDYLKREGIEYFKISLLTRQGLDELLAAIRERCTPLYLEYLKSREEHAA